MPLALSVQQPWAHLLVTGVKDIENRSWRTPWRGRLWIHAGKQFDKDAVWFLRDLGVELPDVQALPRGALVGTVELLGCVQDSPSRWAIGGQWHWQIGRAWTLPEPIPMRGRLGLFPVNTTLPSTLDSRQSGP